MSPKISRRDFLKVAGAGVGAAAILSGCGPDSRYIVRVPYTKMPEYSYNGLSTYYATACRECPAGCGVIVRTMQGRALKIEGNQNHPVNLGRTCSRGQTALQGLYNPDRIHDPVSQTRGGKNAVVMGWEDAVTVLQDVLTSHKPDEIAFLLGMKADHLFDLVSKITYAMDAPAPWRYGAYAMFEGRATLATATQAVMGLPGIPFFDLGNSDLGLSFGADFLETYLSPVAYGRGYSNLRKGHEGKRGYLVHFSPRLSQTAAAADEWIPILPGSEGLVALGIGRAVAESRGIDMPTVYVNLDLKQIAQASGVDPSVFNHLADLFVNASHPLALPGGPVLTHSNGLESAQAILGLNVLAGNLGQPGGVYITPSLPIQDSYPALPHTYKDIASLVDSMKSGAIKVLFIHGVNPVFEFPASLGFSEALSTVEKVISFASFPDETSLSADYVFPDSTNLESWGYQKILTGGNRPVISGAQPVVVPLYNTKATADVLLAAVQAIGGPLAQSVPYKDQVEFLQDSVQGLIAQDGYFHADEIQSFWAQWQQYGGWWAGSPGLGSPAAPNFLNQALELPVAEFDGDGGYYLHLFPSPLLGDGTGANKPWLQETPDPTTTVMWNSWVEIHPDTADKLGLQDDEVVKVTSPYGEVELSVYRYPAIRPDTIAIPFGQGHSAFGRYAEGRGANPGDLLGSRTNSAGDLAVAATKVKITKTGKKKQLARYESKLGVYGNLQP